MERHDNIAVIHGNDGELDLKKQINGNLQAYEEIGFEGDISDIYRDCNDYSQYEELPFDGCDNPILQEVKSTEVDMDMHVDDGQNFCCSSEY